MRDEGANVPAYPLSASDLAALVRAAVPAGFGDSPSGEARVASASSTIAIGAFDGVHRGHRALISSCVADAHARGERAVVVTFDPDPSELLAGDAADARLLCVADRAACCRALGADEVLVLPFDRALAALSPRAFVDLLAERLGPISCAHVGENFRFGARGSGDVSTLAALGAELGFSVVTHRLLTLDGAPVSSTRVRGLLARGEVDAAARLLGRCHFVRGHVAHGRGEGTAFGFPTANVVCDARTCMPGEGVYACAVTDGTYAWPAAANVGAPPTFDGRRAPNFLEANLLGFSGDLYGSELAVVFLRWLRASRPFDSLEELERVVLGNIDWVRRNVGAESVEVRP